MTGFAPIRRLIVGTCICGCLVGFSTGLNCGGGFLDGPLDPTVPAGNRPPRIQITALITESNDMVAEQGEMVDVQFTGDDGEDEATVRLFASTSQVPTPAGEIPIADGILIGPGQESGTSEWDTTGVPVGSYFIFAEIDDGVNDPVRAISGIVPLALNEPGTRPQNVPPNVFFLTPVSNLGLSTQDEVTIQYAYTDPDDSVTLTLLLDKDQNPNNDDISNPGDPFDPASNIVLLPSEPRRTSDPTFDGDPPPPDDPNNPPGQADSLEIRTNPRTLGSTAPGLAEFKEYRFTIDFSKIPPRSQPFYIRATIQDGHHMAHRYAVGSLTFTRLANGVVDVNRVGFELAGARWTGFSAGENLGSDVVGVPDIDGDTIDEFMIAGRFASPRNRDQAGAAYLIFGRSKVPFPLDTNGNGLPDVIDGNGNTVDFPPPPSFVTNPYLPANVGRFGGEQNINSVNSFYRGTTYGMPEAHGDRLPPESLRDPLHPGLTTAGLTSITRLDMTGDGVPDLVFGLPYVSWAQEYHDDDPVDGGCDFAYQDGLPNDFRCNQATNDDLSSLFSISFVDPIDQGLVIMVDGTNDIANTFRTFTDAGIAGQYDPGLVLDDDGIYRAADTIPEGARMRGGWYGTPFFGRPIDPASEYGKAISATPSLDDDLLDDLLVSIPGWDNHRGAIQVWPTENFIADFWYSDGVRSLPSYASFGCSLGMPTYCQRGYVVPPVSFYITGQRVGDEFGFAGAAGQFNQDGIGDIMCGAPGADRAPGNTNGDELVDNGILYVLFTPAGGYGNTDLEFENIPRVEIRGTHAGDRFGEVQTEIDDVNGDSISDIAFASEMFDDDINGNADAGYVGVIFGHRPLTGENGFSPDDVGTPQLSGVRFFGATVGARAGHSISTAGDFNSDRVGDLLISSPGERRDVNVGDTDGDGIDEIETRLGVAYLIFGGTHLINKTFNLSQVGNPELPGIVFISRFALGSENQAELEMVGGIGDIDGDGFGDIALGAPTADFINTASPDQRRVDAGELYIVYGNNFGSNNVGSVGP